MLNARRNPVGATERAPRTDPDGDVGSRARTLARSAPAQSADLSASSHSGFLPYLLNRVVSQINAPMQTALRLRGLTMTHWRVLGFLAERDGLIVSELADRTITDQATLSRALMRLEARGLIERVPGVDDSRLVAIHLLASGRAVYDEICISAREVENWAFAELDESTRATLRETLDALSESISARSYRVGETEPRTAAEPPAAARSASRR